MFSKVLTVCFVLYTVQVLGGSIKPKLSLEVQNVVQNIDMQSLLMENDIKKAATDKKHDVDMVKLNTKMALKQLKTALKEAKGTLCGQVANLQARAVEQRADDVKLCNNKLNLKELQQDLHSYLKNLHEEAMLVDRYCAFINTDAAEIAQCVTDSVAALEAKLNDVQSVMSVGLGNHLNESSECLKSIVDDVQLEAGRIQLEMNDCLNPPTEAPVEETEAPAHDSSESKESQSSESSESKESASNESGSSSNENNDENNAASEEPSESATEDSNNTNEGNAGDDEEQTSEGSNNGEENNDDDGTTSGDGQEGEGNTGNSVEENNDNEVTSGETEAPVEDGDNEEENKESAPVDEETPAEETPAEETPAEENPSEETPAEETPAEETPAEETPAEENPSEETPAEETPAEETPAEESPAEETPAEETPAEDNNNEESASEEPKEPSEDVHPAEIKDDDEINIEY